MRENQDSNTLVLTAAIKDEKCWGNGNDKTSENLTHAKKIAGGAATGQLPIKNAVLKGKNYKLNGS